MSPIKHYLQFSDLSADEYEYLLDRARILKAKFKNYENGTRCTTARWP
jgi:ornithine carbamoyltransferase